MARAITSDELALLRSDGQYSKLYLAVIVPTVIFACRVSGSYVSEDNVSRVYYDTPSSGSYVGVLAGMTVYVGTTPGGYDIGMARVRGLMPADATSICIGRTSDIPWAAGQYLTVVNEYNLWPKQAYFSGGQYFVDDDMAYVDQHSNPPPVPVLGPDVVLELSGSSVQYHANAYSSWSIADGVISTAPFPTYYWDCPGAHSIDDGASGSPTITYTACGNYMVNCYIQSATGQVEIGHRVIYVWNESHLPITDFTLDQLSGTWQDGGWFFEVTAYNQATPSTVRDRAKAILFAKDFYSGSPAALGPVSGAENVICAGWIQGESIVENPEQGSVKFTVQGPHWWLNHLASWPVMLMDVSTVTPYHAVPATWQEYKHLTYDALYWHTLQWCSTATEVIDVYPSFDLRFRPLASAPIDTLWNQITSVGDNNFLIHPCCDRYGRLFAQMDIQYSSLTARAAAPVVMTVTKADWRENLEIDRRIVNEVGQEDAFGLAWSGSPGDQGAAYRSRAFGNALPQLGRIEFRQELTIADKDDLNFQTGAILAQNNNPLPRVLIKPAQNNRFVDLCPYQVVMINVAAADTPRGIVISQQKVVTRQIEIEWDKDNGTLLPTWSGEALTAPTPGVTVPIEFPAPTPPPPPVPPPSPPPIGPPIGPPGPPPNPGCLDTNAPPTGPYIPNPLSGFINSTTGFTHTFVGALKSQLRPAACVNQSTLEISGTLEYSTDHGATWLPVPSGLYEDRWTCYTMDAWGNALVQGVKDPYAGTATGVRTAKFLPPAATEVYGYAVHVEALQEWSKDDLVAEGDVTDHYTDGYPGAAFGTGGYPVYDGHFYAIEWCGAWQRPLGGVWRYDAKWGGQVFLGYNGVSWTYPDTTIDDLVKAWQYNTDDCGEPTLRIFFQWHSSFTRAYFAIPYAIEYLEDYPWPRNDVMHWKLFNASHNTETVDIGFSINTELVYNVCFKL